MKLYSERIIVIPKELFGLSFEVLQSRRKTFVLKLVGNQLPRRVPNRATYKKIIEILRRYIDRLEIK